MTSRFYRPELDGLRFVAALLVFIHHAPELPGLGVIHRIGWVGVDLFLALSAYLITTLAILEREATGEFLVKPFLVRRALRIWPLYFAAALGLCALAVLSGKVDLATGARWAAAHLSFSANILTSVSGYSPIPFSQHLWTIPLEEQAYFVMALLLPAMLAFVSARRVATIAGSAILLLWLARYALLDVPHPFVWTSPLHADAFIFGAVAALLRVEGSAMKLVAGIGLLASLALFPPVGLGTAGDIFIYTVAAAGAILVVVSAPRALGAFRYLGRISYGLYVFHLAALGAAEKLVTDPWAVAGLGLVLTIGVSAASYQLYERPFLRLKERFEVVRTRPA